jgi:hypothetical protein
MYTSKYVMYAYICIYVCHVCLSGHVCICIYVSMVVCHVSMVVCHVSMVVCHVSMSVCMSCSK